VDDVCLPLQIWSVVVVVTAGIAYLMRHKFRLGPQQMKYNTAVVFSWFVSGCVLLSDGECGGEIFGFSVFVMVMVSMPTFFICFYWLCVFAETLIR